MKFFRRASWDLLTAIQFLTRIPIPPQPYEADSLSRSVKFFPLVGLLVGAAAALLHRVLASHVPRAVTALAVITFLLVLTGCLHEDGLADATDGLAGGRNVDQRLLIMRDSRIGSYGAAALILSLLARVLLLASTPLASVTATLIAAHILSRWSILPLSHFLPPARPMDDGQGARIASLTARGTLIGGTVFSFAVVAVLLRERGLWAIAITVAVTLLSGTFYKRRIAGVTGDCFGATNQFTEIAVYFVGAWI